MTGYIDLAQRSLATGSVADARLVLENISDLLPELAEPDRKAITKSLLALQERLAAPR